MGRVTGKAMVGTLRTLASAIVVPAIGMLLLHFYFSNYHPAIQTSTLASNSQTALLPDDFRSRCENFQPQSLQLTDRVASEEEQLKPTGFNFQFESASFVPEKQETLLPYLAESCIAFDCTSPLVPIADTPNNCAPRPSLLPSRSENAGVLPASSDVPAARFIASTKPAAQDTCRLTWYLSTSPTSGIHMEAWLPRLWSGRFLGLGNNGLGGCIDYNGLILGTQYNFASVASNAGHNGSSGEAFHHKPEVLADFADRATHLTAVTGKQIVQQFYAKPHTKAYFMGCSQGGRQGVGSAEKYPHDFEGIVAGAPALDFNNLASWRGSLYGITEDASSPEFIAPEVWQGLIHNEILRQCEPIDGVWDGILENPDLCHFDPTRLMCDEETSPAGQVETRSYFSEATSRPDTNQLPAGPKSAEDMLRNLRDPPTPGAGTPTKEPVPTRSAFPDTEQQPQSVTCLTPWQVSIVQRVFHQFSYANGTEIYPGLQLGGEYRAVERLLSGRPFKFSEDWFRYVVHAEATTTQWTAKDFDAERDARAAQDLNPFNIRTFPDQLDAFNERGGKLLVWHGMQDEQLTDKISQKWYYNLLKRYTVEQVDRFARFFQVSGCNHCRSGPGAWAIGQATEHRHVAAPFEADRNVLAAIVAWVEQGSAPETIEGTKYRHDDSTKGELFRRRHCRYPFRNKFKGSRDKGQSGKTEAGDWECQ